MDDILKETIKGKLSLSDDQTKMAVAVIEEGKRLAGDGKPAPIDYLERSLLHSLRAARALVDAFRLASGVAK